MIAPEHVFHKHALAPEFLRFWESYLLDKFDIKLIGTELRKYLEKCAPLFVAFACL